MSYLNSFIGEIEMLLRCKRYVERRLETLYKIIDRMEGQGKDTTFTKQEIEHLERLLGIRPWHKIEED